MDRLRITPMGVVLALAAAPSPATDQVSPVLPARDETVVGLALEGEEAEAFLRSAKVVDQASRVYLIDSSRAFRIQKELLAPDDLQCFSRRVLERLAALDRPTLEEHLGRWLDGMQIDGLLARRTSSRAWSRCASRRTDRVRFCSTEKPPPG